jgi:hypothetical protein
MGRPVMPMTPVTFPPRGKRWFPVTVVPFVEPKMPWLLDYGFYIIMACIVVGILVSYFA